MGREVQPSLHYIAAKNDVDLLVQMLSSLELAALIDINKRNKNDNDKTALHVAAEKNWGSSHYKMAEILLNNGADPNAKDRYGNTPLFSFIQTGSLEILNLFSKFNADFTCLNKHGESLLTPALYNVDHNLDVVKFLVEDIGLDVNYKNKDILSPLYDAAFRNHIESHYEVLKFLLENGADVNFRDVGNAGITPIWQLARAGNLKVVDLFLSHNADVHAISDDGFSILFAFHDEFSDVRVLEKLIDDFKLDVNCINDNKQTPLHHIMKFGFFCAPNVKVIKCLLKNGANVNTYDKEGVTPLISAMRIIQADNEGSFFKNIGYLNIFMDETDFSVIHNNAHIFDYHSYQKVDYYFWNNPPPHLCQTDKLWKWIVEHLAKLQFLSIPVHPLVIEFIEDRADYKDYFEKCTEELEVISKTKPQNSWINFFNLLVDSRRKLKNYAGNEDLIEECEKKYFLKKFPIYGALMKKNVKKGIKRRELFDKSSILLSHCLPIFNPNHLIVKDTLDCILGKKDLSKFCE